jgi:ATP-dependent RNA helicase DDX42
LKGSFSFDFSHFFSLQIKFSSSCSSYIKLMEEKGHQFGKTSTEVSGDVNSDDEVYAAEKAQDEKFDADGNPIGGRRDVEPLAAVDHSKIQYPEIEKNFYEEHPDIQALTSQQVSELRHKFEIKVFGSNVPKPAVSFAHFGFDEALLQTIAKHGYTEPTAIQKQAIPVALSGRDIIGIAKTGSGKTAGNPTFFLLFLLFFFI